MARVMFLFVSRLVWRGCILVFVYGFGPLGGFFFPGVWLLGSSFTVPFDMFVCFPRWLFPLCVFVVSGVGCPAAPRFLFFALLKLPAIALLAALPVLGYCRGVFRLWRVCWLCPSAVSPREALLFVLLPILRCSPGVVLFWCVPVLVFVCRGLAFLCVCGFGSPFFFLFFRSSLQRLCSCFPLLPSSQVWCLSVFSWLLSG